ncbi:cysteine and histidine-rich domain-containing protein morgana [Harmonia axyridis]|uniref:cysteine and histidine-rich domain-containing protein morgana n=1 Tax=Harmonia axyridis TaxID=115357 RepID=UPI001E2783F8|nr:cysteine and histidine-rich domain-containing protein morgana [Harmonia axyridis]
MENTNLLQCYNRGCGQKFNPNENKEDSCRHHPGDPFFHDAYKGWSCCNKKCTDFTEFLNIKGCTVSFHSNIKPPEPEKPKTQELDISEVIEVKPIVPNTLPRPPFDSQMTLMKPEIAPSLKQQIFNKKTEKEKTDTNEIPIGTNCKNGGCKVTYQGLETNDSKCIYHPGYPVFHEGLKFWSCCKKRTSDFQSFLDQIGCEEGNHLWKKEGGGKSTVNCRWDYHQTASHVIVTIYAKQYDVEKTEVKLNPIRLSADLIFPTDNTRFSLDLELKGIIDVDKSKISMFSTKVEISLKKAEPGSWSRLEIPRTVSKVKDDSKFEEDVDKEITTSIDLVDLSDL